MKRKRKPKSSTSSDASITPSAKRPNTTRGAELRDFRSQVAGLRLTDGESFEAYVNRLEFPLRVEAGTGDDAKMVDDDEEGKGEGEARRGRFVRIPEWFYNLGHPVKMGPILRSASRQVFVSSSFRDVLLTAVSNDQTLVDVVTSFRIRDVKDFLLLTGSKGVGKSHLMYLLALLAFANERPVIYFRNVDSLMRVDQSKTDDEIANLFVQNLLWWNQDLRCVAECFTRDAYDYVTLTEVLREANVSPVVLVDSFNDLIGVHVHEAAARTRALRTVMKLFQDKVLSGTSKVLFSVEECDSSSMMADFNLDAVLQLQPLATFGEVQTLCSEPMSSAYIPSDLFSEAELADCTGFVPFFLHELAKQVSTGYAPTEVPRDEDAKRRALRAFFHDARESVEKIATRRLRKLSRVLDAFAPSGCGEELLIEWLLESKNGVYAPPRRTVTMDLTLFSRIGTGQYQVLFPRLDAAIKDWMKYWGRNRVVGELSLDSFQNLAMKGLFLEDYLSQRLRHAVSDLPFVRSSGVEDTLSFSVTRERCLTYRDVKKIRYFRVDRCCLANECVLYSTSQMSSFRRIDLVVVDRGSTVAQDRVFFIQATVSSFAAHVFKKYDRPLGEIGEFLLHGYARGRRPPRTRSSGGAIAGSMVIQESAKSDLIGILNSIYGLNGGQRSFSVEVSDSSRVRTLRVVHPDGVALRECLILYVGTRDLRALSGFPLANVGVVSVEVCRTGLGLPFSCQERDNWHPCFQSPLRTRSM